jgi:hypothetical protein
MAVLGNPSVHLWIGEDDALELFGANSVVDL